MTSCVEMLQHLVSFVPCFVLFLLGRGCLVKLVVCIIIVNANGALTRLLVQAPFVVSCLFFGEGFFVFVSDQWVKLRCTLHYYHQYRAPWPL